MFTPRIGRTEPSRDPKSFASGSWNFAHIANAMAKRRIEIACRHAGFECPVICSPDELMEEADDER